MKKQPAPPSLLANVCHSIWPIKCQTIVADLICVHDVSWLLLCECVSGIRSLFHVHFIINFYWLVMSINSMRTQKKHVHTSKIMQMNRATKNSLVNCFSLCPFDNSLRISRHEAKKIPTHTYTVRKRDICIFFLFSNFLSTFSKCLNRF